MVKELPDTDFTVPVALIILAWPCARSAVGWTTIHNTTTHSDTNSKPFICPPSIRHSRGIGIFVFLPVLTTGELLTFDASLAPRVGVVLHL